jgi:hypothetical protein
MIRAFTGPSSLTEEQRFFVASRLLQLAAASEHDELWRSGCAHGVDTIVARFAYAIEINFELIIPLAAHNETMVRQLAPAAAAVRRVERPSNPELTNAAAYRRRNEVMVNGSPAFDVPPCDTLVAFLFKPEFYRSGEWMTVNIAHKTNTVVLPYLLPQ